MLVIYDIRNPAKPEEVSRWWLSGQHTAGGEKPTWPGRRNRLHHALRVGDLLWAGCWMAGAYVIDVSDIRNPKTAGSYNYHPPFVEPTKSAPRLLSWDPVRRRMSVADEEADRPGGAREGTRPAASPTALLAASLRRRRRSPRRARSIHPSRAAPGRFGAHQFFERMKAARWSTAPGSRAACGSSTSGPGGSSRSRWFIPEPARGRAGPMTNDVDVTAAASFTSSIAGRNSISLNSQATASR
jgi:hypothetical protein